MHVDEPQRRNNEVQANGLGQRNPHQPPALKGRPTQSPQTNLHHGGTYENRRILRATGCQGGLTGSPPDSGGAGARSEGVVTRP